MVRPSYVLGGRAMAIVYDEQDLLRTVEEAVRESFDRPILIDHFLEDALEYDLDALCQGKDFFVAGIIEHIERAGVHSGDSCGVLPAKWITPELKKQMIEWTGIMSANLNIVGLMNIQFAVQNESLRAGGESPRLAHRAVHQQSHRIASRKNGDQADGGQKTSDFALPSEMLAARTLYQGAGLPVHQISR